MMQSYNILIHFKKFLQINFSINLCFEGKTVGVNTFQFNWIIYNVVPQRIYFYKLNGDGNKIGSRWSINASSEGFLGSVINADRYIFESKDRVRLVVSTLDGQTYGKEFSGTKFGAASKSELAVMVTAGD